MFGGGCSCFFVQYDMSRSTVSSMSGKGLSSRDRLGCWYKSPVSLAAIIPDVSTSRLEGGGGGGEWKRRKGGGGREEEEEGGRRREGEEGRRVEEEEEDEEGEVMIFQSLHVTHRKLVRVDISPILSRVCLWA